LSAKYPTAETDPVAEADLAAKGISQSGLLTNRPAAASGNAGLLYYATDDNGGTLYRSDGSSWTKIAAPTTQLQYVERITNDTGFSNTTYADVTGLSITFTAGSKPIWLEFYTPIAVIGTSGAALFVQICDSTAATTYVESTPTAAATNQNIVLPVRRLLTGVFTQGTSYTVKVQRKVSSGVATLKGAAPNGPMYLVAREA
jgi:hypothetical protein